MEFKNCEQYVLAELEAAKAEIEELKEAKETWYGYYREEEEKVKKLRADYEDAVSELDRALVQMAELESQMKHMADKYNDLARSTTVTVSNFEPVRETGDE